MNLTNLFLRSCVSIIRRIGKQLATKDFGICGNQGVVGVVGAVGLVTDEPVVAKTRGARDLFQGAHDLCTVEQE